MASKEQVSADETERAVLEAKSWDVERRMGGGEEELGLRKQSGCQS